MATQNNPHIAKAEELLQRLGSQEDVRRYYEAREKSLHDEATRLAGARDEGRVEGKIEGIRETALNMLAKGLPDELIIEITKLSPVELAKLKKELTS